MKVDLGVLFCWGRIFSAAQISRPGGLPARRLGRTKCKRPEANLPPRLAFGTDEVSEDQAAIVSISRSAQFWRGAGILSSKRGSTVVPKKCDYSASGSGRSSCYFKPSRGTPPQVS
jgi:hypothetical protein